VDRKTRTALDKSIKHWERIRDGVDKCIGSDYCALCELFLYWDGFNHPGQCEGCPVREDTGRQYCYGSPYVQFSDFKSALDHEGLHFADLQDKRGQKRLYQRRVQLAQAEIDFLKSLRVNTSRKLK
jgi:hypothetical protein